LTDLEPQKTSLSDALISLIPIYGPWMIFGIVALESAGVPRPGEAILVAAALLAATTGQIKIVIVVLAAAAGAIVGDGMGYMAGRQWTHCGLLPSHRSQLDAARTSVVRSVSLQRSIAESQGAVALGFPTDHYRVAGDFEGHRAQRLEAAAWPLLLHYPRCFR
jgi:hypothetical protein